MSVHGEDTTIESQWHPSIVHDTIEIAPIHIHIRHDADLYVRYDECEEITEIQLVEDVHAHSHICNMPIIIDYFND